MKRLLLPLLAAITLTFPVVANENRTNYSNPNKQFYRVEIDPLTDETEIQLMILSEDKVDNSIGVPRFNTLILRCKNNNKLSLFFGTPTYNGNEEWIFLRWDKEKTIKDLWNKSSNGQNYFAPKPNDFLKKIKEHESLIFGWNPYQRRTVATKFELRNLDQLLGWAKEDGCKIDI
jgi:hypothetical protein